MKTTTIHGESRRILVIDDHEAIHDDYRKIFAGPQNRDEEIEDMNAQLFDVAESFSPAMKFELDFASQGAEGIALFQKAMTAGRPYAMAFIDVRMPPGLDGIETTAGIWKLCRDFPVVLCTAYSDHSWDDIVRKLGQRNHLVVLKKPFDNIEVLQLAYTLTAQGDPDCGEPKPLTHLEKMRTSDLRKAGRALQSEIEERDRSKARLIPLPGSSA